MNEFPWITQLVSKFIPHLPVLAVALVGMVLVAMRWQSGTNVSLWALLGFGLAVVLAFAVPIGQLLMARWAMQGGQAAERAGAFTALAVLWSVLRAASYGFLLVACLSSRSQPVR